MVVMAVLLVLTLLGQVNVVLYLIRLDRRVARVEAMHGRLNAL
jgi:Tfp pilus assembly protein PilX